MKDFTGSPKTERQQDRGAAERQPFGPPVLPEGAARETKPVAYGATMSLVFGLLSISCLWIFGSIPAIYLGARALGKIKASEGALSGRGMALVGISSGLIGVVLGAWWVLLVLFTVNVSVQGV